MTPPEKNPRLCPSCGTRITGRRSTCPSCGKKVDSSAKIECPFCGESIPKSSDRCPICKLDLPGKSAKTRSKSGKKTTDKHELDVTESKPTPLKEEDNKPGCPQCGWLLDGKESKCPKCGYELKGEIGLRCSICETPLGKGLKECPKCGVPIGYFNEVMEDQKRANSRTCPLCGAIIPKSLSDCPVCHTTFVETEPKEEVRVPGPELLKPQLSEDTTPAPVAAGPPAVRPTRQRKLKVAKVTTVPAAVQNIARGRTNGVSHVNGLSKVNGTGATNGGAFVNGTGVSSGLGTQSKKGSAMRSSFLTRWQFLSVLVATVIVISTFIFLSYAQEKQPVSVDGKFGEWASVQKFGMYTSAGSAPINVDNWAVSHAGAKFFMYVKAQADIMGAADVNSFYLFIDNDNSLSTGYALSEIGADYLVELDGWNGSVQASSVSEYRSEADQYDWNAWVPVGSASASVTGMQLEASAELPKAVSSSAKLILLSKDNLDRNAISYPMPQTGGLLVIKQEPGTCILGDGTVASANSLAILKLTLTCEGAAGSVDDIVPYVSGAALSFDFQKVSLVLGKETVINVSVDTSSSAPGTFVEALVSASGVNSTFAGVEVVGIPARAYVTSPPMAITIDGAFADWTGKITPDSDPAPVGNDNIDIKAVGEVNSTSSSSFYVSVFGEMLGGSQVPVTLQKPTAGGGGGILIPTKKTGEDILRIYIDSDLSSATGFAKAVASKAIGADYMIEVKGVDGVARPGTLYVWSSDQWVVVSGAFVLAENDRQQIELSVSSSSISSSSSIDFIIETTDWKARGDVATAIPAPSRSLANGVMVGIETWMVDDSTTSASATAMSYQRKVFYDGINFWSFFFDGANTVQKFSVDDGLNWTYGGSVFTTPGVSETSIWYDSSTSTVYAIGDSYSASNNVSIQVGTVNAPAHTISWALSDSSLNTSSVALAGKNTYISKDLNGYLWVLSSNCTVAAPAAYQLSAFRSSDVNSTTSWVFSGQMLTTASTTDDVKGSIVPAGSGSSVWAVFAYSGNVAASKYDGGWQTSQPIYKKGTSMTNTDNSPPSVVVDGKGVVHVVYGTGRKTTGTASRPTIEYSHNNTDLTTFTAVPLDPLIASGVGDYYPTITLDTSTGNLHVLWLQGNTSSSAKTVMGRKCVSGTWSNMTIAPQTGFAKQYLTSIYSVSGEFKVCWQWTQNATAPIEVLIDHPQIPEFGNLSLPIIGFIVMFAVYRQMSRGKRDRHDRQAQSP